MGDATADPGDGDGGSAAGTPNRGALGSTRGEASTTARTPTATRGARR